MKKTVFVHVTSALALTTALAAGATTVPGHTDRYDSDDNGYPDAGVKVTGHYTSVYAYDANGDWWWDLGDGRVQGTVGSLADLDGLTLSVCEYINNYRADFGNDAFMDAGWIINNISCSGYEGQGHWMYQIVHESDPRYRGNPDRAIWGSWEYHVLAESGLGNVVRPLTGPENHNN